MGNSAYAKNKSAECAFCDIDFVGLQIASSKLINKTIAALLSGLKPL